MAREDWRIHCPQDRASDRYSSTGGDDFYLMDENSWKEVVKTQYREVDLLPTGVLKSKLTITSSYGSNSTSKP